MYRRNFTKGIGGMFTLPFLSNNDCRACKVVNNTENDHDLVYYGHPDEHTMDGSCMYENYHDRFAKADTVETAINGNEIPVLQVHYGEGMCYKEGDEYLGFNTVIKGFKPKKVIQGLRDSERCIANNEHFGLNEDGGDE